MVPRPLRICCAGALVAALAAADAVRREISVEASRGSVILSSNAADAAAASVEGRLEDKPAGQPSAKIPLLSFVGGALSASGANVLAWSSHRVRESGQEWTGFQSALFVLLCLALNLGGIGAFASSCALGGAVATVMPIQVGANLLANMFWQTILGLKYFDKVMQLSTLILVCAVAQLVDLGPQAPIDIDVAKLLAAPLARLWCALLAVALLGSLAALFAVLRDPPGSMRLLASVTSVVTLTTVIGSSLSKCFSLVQGLYLALVVGLYFVDGLVLLYFTVFASANCDVSLFIPAQLASQLVVNMLTGYMVWGDAAYISNPLAYVLVYTIAILAVYLMSPSLDATSHLVRMWRVRNTKLSESVAPSRLGRSVLTLLGAWEREPKDGEACREALRETLTVALERGAISDKDMIDFVLLQLQDNEYRPTATLVHWIENLPHFALYTGHDDAFKKSFRKYLDARERVQLAALGETTCRQRADLEVSNAREPAHSAASFSTYAAPGTHGTQSTMSLLQN
eukprot:TRINITY_DN9308_c1_g5_i1.p1 TRINITY_DN9308_c1_g5~~TRINITY_DN9308_c1_g5_i1.p1  ORF type:complete len:566 (+),score=99.72 TRINITY_DN9308_c1_g5_i1:159-1700(+)